MRRRLLLLLIVAGMILLPAFRAAADPLIPDRPAGAESYSVRAPLYDDPRYEPWAYTFEGAQWNSPGYIGIYFGMNQLLVTKAWLLKMALRVVEYALSVPFYAPVLPRLQSILTTFDSNFWSGADTPLVAGALSLTGLWALLLYVRGRTSRVWAALGGSILIIMASTAVLTAGPDTVTKALGLARDATAQVYGTADHAFRDSAADWSLLARSGDGIWRTLVYEPWQMGELSGGGRTLFRSGVGLDGGEFLAKSVQQRQETCLYNPSAGQAYCPWWQVEFLPRRMLLALWTFLATAVYAGVLVLLAGGIILGQLTVLFLVALAPVWLVVALWWPERGVGLLWKLLVQVLGSLAGQALLAATLAVLLLFSRGITEGFAAAGRMFQSVLLVILALVAFRYRYGWLTPLAAVRDRLEREPGETAVVRFRRRTGGRTEASDAPGDGVREAIPVFSAMAAYEPVRPTRVEEPRVRGETAVSMSSSPVQRFERQMHEVRELLRFREETLLRTESSQRTTTVHLEPPVPVRIKRVLETTQSSGQNGPQVPPRPHV
ncbi:MAG TPA: hypothetical protein VGK74_06400 [Symbiobacteriaceae bacterium]